VLKQVVDRTSIAEVRRRAGMAEVAFYNWCKKYAGVLPSEVKRLKNLDENSVRLK